LHFDLDPPVISLCGIYDFLPCAILWSSVGAFFFIRIVGFARDTQAYECHSIFDAGISGWGRSTPEEHLFSSSSICRQGGGDLTLSVDSMTKRSLESLQQRADKGERCFIDVTAVKGKWAGTSLCGRQNTGWNLDSGQLVAAVDGETDNRIEVPKAPPPDPAMPPVKLADLKSILTRSCNSAQKPEYSLQEPMLE